MTSVELIAPQLKPPIERSRPGKVTGRLLKALDAMVWQGLNRKKAAKVSGLTEHSLYVALRRPHVKAHYLAELEVLRTSERARNIHRAVAIRDAANNMPALNALKWLDGTDDERAVSTRTSIPGLVVQIINQALPHQGGAASAQVIDNTELGHPMRVHSTDEPQDDGP